MSRNGWIIFVVICIAVLGGLVWLSQGNRVDVSNVDRNTVLAASEDSGNIADHTLGNEQAEVTVVEYGDFQCPGCADAHPVLKQVVTKYEDDIVFIFRNFPLSTIHPNARAASAVAEAAGLQNKYWEMHDLLFQNQAEWQNLGGATRTDLFANYAVALELDREQFIADLESDSVIAKINFDSALGREAGVTGTPGIFVNGEEVDGYYLDDEIVPRGTEGANPIWSNAEAFESLVLLPALRDAGVNVETE